MIYTKISFTHWNERTDETFMSLDIHNHICIIFLKTNIYFCNKRSTRHQGIMYWIKTRRLSFFTIIWNDLERALIFSSRKYLYTFLRRFLRIKAKSAKKIVSTRAIVTNTYILSCGAIKRFLERKKNAQNGKKASTHALLPYLILGAPLPCPTIELTVHTP